MRSRMRCADAHATGTLTITDYYSDFPDDIEFSVSFPAATQFIFLFFLPLFSVSVPAP
jgi:hypothetical protein